MMWQNLTMVFFKTGVCFLSQQVGITLFTVSHRKSLWKHHEVGLDVLMIQSADPVIVSALGFIVEAEQTTHSADLGAVSLCIVQPNTSVTFSD